MRTELQRARLQLADAIEQHWKKQCYGETDMTEQVLAASHAFEDLIDHRGVFEPIDLPSGRVVSFKRLTENSVTAVLSGAGKELVREEVERPTGGMGAFGDARFRADQVRRRRSWAGELQAARKTDEVVRGATREAEEAEATLRTHVLANQDAFQGPSLVAGFVRDWLKGDQREIASLVEALATPAPSRASGVSEN